MTSPLTARRRRQHGNPFNIRGELIRPAWRELFGRVAPFALDIGCGPGSFTLELARAHKELDVVGLEIRRHLVEELNATAAAAGIHNLHAVLANANLHLPVLFELKSLRLVTLNFPDPWYKKRHHKRRVVNPAWTRALAPHLEDGASVHIMTDYEPLAREIERTFATTPGFVNVEGEGVFAAASTTGITSERERTHARRGEPIYRLHFRYVGLATYYPRPS